MNEEEIRQREIDRQVSAFLASSQYPLDRDYLGVLCKHGDGSPPTERELRLAIHHANQESPVDQTEQTNTEPAFIRSETNKERWFR